MSRTTRLLCKLSIALFLMASVLSMASGAAAQSAGTGSIVGRVTDEKGSSVAGAKVTVRSLDTNATRDVDTNGEGEFRVVLLQPGDYEVTVEQQGFSIVKRSPIRVGVGSTSAADIQLKVAGVSQTITVSEQAPITDPEKVEVTSTVTQKQIEELPTNGRRWDNFVLLTPGVSMDGTFGLISYRGISGLLNNNTIDGADNNQAFFSEARGRTRAANTYSQAGVKEFQVGLSNFSAEFGRAAGGTVNAVTKSGTNQIHGEAFYFIRDDALQAREPTLSDNSGNPLKNQDRRQQYGLALGTPIIKDKLFFFGDWEQFHRTQTFLVRSAGNFLTTFIPTCTSGSGNAQLAQNCNALLNFETSQGGQQPRIPINNTALGKADWVITPNHTLSGTYNWHRWQSENGVQTQQVIARGLSDNGKDIVKTDSVVARLSSVLSRNMVNQAQFQYSRDFEQQIGNSADPRTTVTNGISFGMSEFLPRPAWPNEKRFQWTDTLSWTVGRHAFKTGGDINYVRDNSINLFNGGGAYSYSGGSAIQSLALDCPAPTRTGSSPCVPDATPIGKHWTSYTQAFDVRGLNPLGQLFFTTTDYNVFFQDTFKWRPTVTVNAGLRYEFQHMPSVEPINFNGTQLLGYPQFPESQFINQDTNNFGPRLALAWDIGGKQKNVIRIGGGIYYGRTGNALIRSHLLENGVGLPSFSFSSSSPSQLATGPVYPSVLASQPLTSGTRSVSFMAGDYVRPFISMTELAYEREIVRNISVSVTYVYTRGNHLTHTADINLNAPTSTVNFFLSDGTPLGSSPFYGGPRPLFDTLVPPGTRLGSVLRATSDLNSTYHGVVFQLTQRARFGLTQQFHFTYSNAKDEGQPQGASPFAARFEQFYDPQNRRAEYSRSEFDLRKRVVWSYIWEPSTIWKIDNKVARSVLGDWSISGVTTLQDGQPFTPTISGSLAGGAFSSGPAACPATGTCATATGTSNGSGGSQRPGWLPRNFILTTGFINFDMRLQKDWRLTESKRLRFIFESFNIFNRANHPNQFNFNSTGFTLDSSKACAAGSTSMSCTAQNPSDLTLPRFATIKLSGNYTGILDPVRGSGDLKGCLATSCLSSASGTLFGPRDVEFALKFIF